MPNPRHERLLRLPYTMRDALQRHAALRGTSVNELIVHILWLWLESKGEGLYQPAVKVDEKPLEVMR